MKTRSPYEKGGRVFCYFFEKGWSLKSQDKGCIINMNVVHVGGMRMNKNATSREEILRVGKELLLEGGPDAVSMRAVAAGCHVAVGALYNYYPSKGAMLSALGVSIWEDVFAPFTAVNTYPSFIDAADALLDAIATSGERLPGFLQSHALPFASGERAQGRGAMHAYFDVLENHLLRALDDDPNIREGVFDQGLSKLEFVTYIMALAIASQHQPRGSKQAMLTLIGNSIY